MPKVDAKEMGARLSALMNDPVLGTDTVEKFAKLVGAERNAASGWLHGYNFPRVATMAELIDRYPFPGLTLDWLYFGKADSLPVALYIRLQALMDGQEAPVVLPEPVVPVLGGSQVKAARRKKATSR